MSAQDRYKLIMLELDKLIGSGLGGDLEVFLVLLALNTQFVSDPEAPLFKINSDNLLIN